MKADDLEPILGALQELDEVLRGLTDFRAYPGLLDRDDPDLHRLLDHVVGGVRDARAIGSSALGRLDELSAAAREEQAALDAAAAPSAPSEPEPARLVGPPVDLERITMANPTGMREAVLLAEHSPEALAAAEAMLTDEDYRVLSVGDGFAASSIYSRLWAAIDLVILDFDLPGMSGELVFDELLAINPQAAVVVSYGETPPEKDKLNAMLSRGLSGFLPKPFERGRLIHQVQSVLNRRYTAGRR